MESSIRLIPKGIGLIYQFFLGKYIDKKYIIPMYTKAHSEYQFRTSVGQYWIRIYQELEISFQMSTRFCESSSKIAIRSNSDRILEEIVLLVEAAGYFDGNFKDEYYTAQQMLVFHNVGFSPKIKSLPDIPPIDFWTLENGNVIFSYQDFSICIVSISQDGKSETIQHKEKMLYLYKSNYLDDLYKGNWQEKSGKYYNIEYINKAKLNLKMKIYGDLNPPPKLVTMEEYLQVNIFLRKYWEVSSFFNRIRCYLLLQDKIISVRFWILVALGRHSEDQDGHLKFDNYSFFLISLLLRFLCLTNPCKGTLKICCWSTL